ncbi:MAG: hypothetical protein KIT82_04040 [Bradyrhizobium sp.]|nr:hypothetical protein [Bradyrhizobium sp.]
MPAALVVCAALLAAGPAAAGAGAGAAAANASASLGRCNAYSGKQLHNCVADVLDTLSNNLRGGENMAKAKRSLSTAASQLRAAGSKAQALSAIGQCRSVIAAILERVRTPQQISAYSAITRVLSRAAALIQSKG